MADMTTHCKGKNHSHEGPHSHTAHSNHAPSVGADNERKVLLSFWLIFSFMLVEVIGGLLSGSLALLADAGHMLTDAGALALAFLAFRLGRRPADARRTFGYQRFEVLAGLFNALTLLAIVIWIGIEAWQRFNTPQPVLAGPMLAVAVAGLLVNLVVFRILTRGDHSHVNIRGAVLHVVGDLLGSVAAIVAAIVIYVSGWTPIDPLLSLLVALLILRSAWRLLAHTLHILLEGAPGDVEPAQIQAHLLARVDGLVEVNHIHLWLISSGRRMATLHVRPTSDDDARAVTRAVERELHSAFGIDHATVAVDWNDADAPVCSLDAPGEHRA
jgi:cobalt-zinc-cadmium efflux system protein